MFSFPFWLSFLIGFLSLSEEILWVRTVSFAYLTLPPTFSFVLVCYLLGIAFGAMVGKRLCRRVANLYGAAAIVLAIAAVTDVLTPVFIAHGINPSDQHLGYLALVIVLTAGLKSVLFPVVHHLGSVSQGPGVGRSMSRIYFGNILGATLGPLLTGFAALDVLNVDECFGVAGAVCLIASIGCVLKSGQPKLMVASVAAALISSLVAQKAIVPGAGSFGRLAAGGIESMTHYIGNRHGVIHTALTAEGEHVYGGNVYDGIASVNVDTNRNRLDRLYIVALAHPAPRQVLFVGLSAGAWVRAIQGVPEVESMDVVEINPGYIDLIRQYPQLSPLLQDPRIHLHTDDGRRWLRRNPDARFDLIIQNMTFHWRANAGNMLSFEYFSELRRHLNPGGIAITNTTGSFDVLATARAAFPYAYRYVNFVYMSERPLTVDALRLGRIQRPDGKLFVAAGAADGSVAALLGTARLEPVEEFMARRQATGNVITDDNLLSEYRDGLRFGPPFLNALAPPALPEFDLRDP
jgi:spermidine synthase